MKKLKTALLVTLIMTTTNILNAQKLGLVRVENGHEAVDLGLSVLWAKTNLDAESPGQLGGCYAWGEVEPKLNCTDENSVWYKKYADDISGSASDAARKQWGGGWRIPTYNECKELVDKCTWNWAEYDGSVGFQVVGPNGKWIFFPAAGHWYGENRIGSGTMGRFWSSTPRRGDHTEAYMVIMINAPEVDLGYFDRSVGCSIRPVLEE